MARHLASEHMKRAKMALRKHDERSKVLKKIGHELKVNPPSRLVKVEKKKGKKAAEKMRRAILLSKARTAGLRIPKK